MSDVVAEKCDVLFVLGSPFDVRNYLSSGLVNELADRGPSVAVVAHKAAISWIAPSVRAGIQLIPIDDFVPTESRRRLMGLIRIAFTVHRRTRAEYRHKSRVEAGKLGRYLAAIGLWYLIDVVSDAEKVAKSWLARLRPRKEALGLMSSLSPSLVVRPNKIGEPTDFELLQAAHKTNIPILMCEGSWDNLTTKGAIWPPARRLLVWGEFSRQQAVEGHGFTDGAVEVTGPPHFDVYADQASLTPREEWFSQRGLDSTRQMIFFAGTTLNKFTHESSIIRLVSDWIESGLLPSSYIWYRPHPRSRTRVEAEGISSIPHVIVDHGVGADDHQPMGNWSVHPRDAVQRADAVNACDVVLSGFSTLAVEGALLGKPSVLAAFDSSGLVGGSTMAPNLDYTHVRHLLKSSWIKTASNTEELQTFLRQFLGPSPEQMSRELREFGLTIANCGDGMGRGRMIEAIHEMLVAVRSGGGGSSMGSPVH